MINWRMNNAWKDKSMKGWKDKSMKGWKDKSMKWWKDERKKECTNQSLGLIFKVLCSLVWIITIGRMNEWNTLQFELLQLKGWMNEIKEE